MPANGTHLTPHLVPAAPPEQAPGTARDDPQPGSRPSRLPPAWNRPVLVRTAGTALAAAIVLLALHTDSAIIAAGLLALAAAGTAFAAGRQRSRWPDTADAAPVILTALTLATALSVLLGV